MEKLTKIASIAAVAGLLVGGIGASAYNHYTAPDVEKLVSDAKVASFKEGKDSVVPTVVTEMKTVEVPVEKIVSVDNGNLAAVEQALLDNSGDVSYCTSDLDDDEASLVGDCIVFTNDLKSKAVDKLKAEVASLVNKETVNGTTIHRSDVERVRVHDDLDQISVTDLDFKDKDAELSLDFTFEQDDVKYKGTAIAVYKDGDFDDLDLDSLSLN